MPFSAADAQDGFSFTVTYDDTATTDLAADSHIGVYATAIQTTQLTVGSVVVSPWSRKNIVIFDDLRGSDPNPSLVDMCIANSLEMPVALDDAGNTRQRSFDLSFFNISGYAPVEPLASDALVTPAGFYDSRKGAGIRYLIEDYDAQNASLGVRAEAETRVESFRVYTSEVPLPATAWLFPAAVAAAGLRARRRLALR